jgi:hypothetical protein
VKLGRRFNKPMAPPKKEGVGILIKRDKEGHSTLIKGEMHQKDITIINLYAPKISASNFIKHTVKDIKECIDPNTVVVGDFTTPIPNR